MSFAKNPIIFITLMFALTQFLALASGILLISSAHADPNMAQFSVSPIGDSNSLLNSALMVGYVLFGALIALFIIKFLRTKIFFRLLELIVVGGTVSVFFFSFIFALSNLGFFESLAISILMGGAFSILKFYFGSLKNLAAILSSAGVAAIFGYSLGFWPAVAFVLALSLYDYLAVFKTKHMLTLAQGLGSGDMSFTITAKAKNYDAAKAGKISHGSDDEVSRLDLGSGDLAVPAMLAVSTFPTMGLIGSLAIIAGSIASIYLTLNFVVKKHVVLPALPPICLGSLLALLLFESAKLFLGF